jgi:glycosyltransferase involved in cell wall biosynthesis
VNRPKPVATGRATGRRTAPEKWTERAWAQGSGNGRGAARPDATIEGRRAADGAQPAGRVRAEGKFFSEAGQRFEFRGVTYGTFAPRGDGAQFPEREQVECDLGMIREAGFSVLRTYTLPSDDFLDAAADHGLRVLPDVFYPDWRYLLGGSRRQNRRVAREARQEVRRAARRLAGNEQVLALSLGNEVPADVLRWHGINVVADTIRELVEIVREEDPDQLATYANYPTAEYLPLECLDFLMFNVFLERREDFRRYLTRLHQLAGDRPLVLGEVGISAGEGPDGEHDQAEALEWQLETAIDRGVAGTCVFSWTDEWHVGGAPVTGWRFGLTRADRSRRAALEVASRWNQRTVRDLDFEWPSISVVVSAHNCAATLDECLRHACALDYPDLEVIVVDDGSTDATCGVAMRYPEVRLVQIDHGGLAVARNEGFRAARGELVAYLDADAYPTPEWPYYLALGLDRADVGGVGGPNLPPQEDDGDAEVVARSPGGPLHVLTSDDRAEHIPGCNMAFWKIVLSEVGGFDPVYTAAGDDVDLCWKVLDRNWKIGFHPAAVVWHHRRSGLRDYLRQQHTYGRAEALVEARHPGRFTSSGAARWQGRIYNSLTPSLASQRIYRGAFGGAAYQSVYQAGGHVLDLLHQIGVPIAALLLLTAPLALISPLLALPALVAVIALSVLAAVDMKGVNPPRGRAQGRLSLRAKVAAYHLLQPLVRWWARSRHRQVAHRNLRFGQKLPSAVRRLRGGVVVVPEDRPRSELAAELVDALRRRGIRAIQPSGWEDYDARLLLSPLLYGDLQTSSHPEGFVQVRIRTRPRWQAITVAVAAGLAVSFVSPILLTLLVVPAASLTYAAIRARRLPARILAADT